MNKPQRNLIQKIVHSFLRSANSYNRWQKIRDGVDSLLGHNELKPNYIAACPECFHDQGLKLLALKVAIEMGGACPNCTSTKDRKIRLSELEWIAHTFFVWGTLQRPDFGGYPAIQFNESQKTSVEFSDWLKPDVKLFEKVFGIGFFAYGPRFWMFGEIEPLKALQKEVTRANITKRIVSEFPATKIGTDTVLYRVRKSVKNSADPKEYDSPPAGSEGSGRLDSKGAPVLYASSNLDICVHECRIAAEDEAFVATLKPTRELRILNLAYVLEEKKGTEFESLDLTVHMLFLAGQHSYEMSRYVALAAREAGFDGISYPSYFSLLQTSAMPFMTIFGISHRRIPQFRESENAKMIPNLAIFGRPIENGTLSITCINRLMLNAVEYSFHFGPVGYQ